MSKQALQTVASASVNLEATTAYRPPEQVRVVDTSTGQVGVVHGSPYGVPTITLRRLGGTTTWEVSALDGWRYPTAAEAAQASAREPRRSP
ncbi:hypothetical protein ACFW1A_23675 [Kitasatospora sp. NPDC058965]|uniref:hypothetical protein n=1 Tax=Kitasatospora sp. NPDC058965 TaxID=3346682 RepID=UPI00367D4B13